uniref:BED-type domain-containing protein n=1 Tax=Salmo trutta TaxID=8032 RepID=A0A674F1U9_SALTR
MAPIFPYELGSRSNVGCTIRLPKSGFQYSMAPRKRSVVWSFFRAVDEKKVTCLLCLETVLHCGHTTNMLRHLRSKHLNEYSSAAASKDRRSVAADDNNGDSGPKHTNLSRRIGEVALKQSPGKFPGRSDDCIYVNIACEGEVRVLERERELTEALRRAQQQEARALEQQRELLETLRRANAREASAEKEALETLRRSQEQEARCLQREREDLQRERVELQMEKERMQREREELECLRRESGQERSPVQTRSSLSLV